MDLDTKEERGRETMYAVAVDDEPLMLRALKKAVSASDDITSVSAFSSCDEVLRWVGENPVDIAFLDIDMRGMGGLTLAERIRTLRPQCKIIFCTGYEQYAVEAFHMHVSGYLMKPIDAQSVQKEIDYIKNNIKTEKLLTVRCFGEFEVFHNGQIVHFPRRKSKELFAYLIDRQGSAVSGRTIAARLWGDGDIEKNLNYLRQISMNLRKVLEGIGAKDIFYTNNKQYYLNTEPIDCDYFQYLKSGKVSMFQGEYMTQYSWAEETCGLLWKNRKNS